jgi:PKD repeat protein
MANSTQVNTQVMPQQNQIATWRGNSSIVLGSRRTRPLWFDGRFLAARDLERDQNRFLQRQAALGRAAGFGVIHGLLVTTVSSSGQAADAETIVISAGQGITPSGWLVMIPNDLTVRISDLEEEESLDVQFGISTSPTPVARTRTGLYVVALRPVQFTANPIASYPTNIQGSVAAQDGSIVEATAVSLVPYPAPSSNYGATTQNAAVARQIFMTGNPGRLSDSLLPLAMISIQDGAIAWLDPYMVRRDSGPEFSGLRFGLSDPATQQAYLRQYDAQLQQAVNPFVQNKQPARFAATDYFQALPPAGPFPLASISTDNFTQLFFPQQTNVSLSIVPDDELPALIDDGMSLPPIDLTLAASAYADLSVSALIPVPRRGFEALAANLKSVALAAAVPQVQSLRKPLGPLQFYQRGTTAGVTPAAISTLVNRINPLAISVISTGQSGAAAQSTWQQAIGTQIYGYYIRQRSAPVFVSPDNATASTTTVLTASPIAGALGLTLTATVTPPAASGTVTFMDGSTALGTVVVAAGTSTLALPFAAGAHVLTAVYHGDANFSASTSAAQNQTVT